MCFLLHFYITKETGNLGKPQAHIEQELQQQNMYMSGLMQITSLDPGDSSGHDQFAHVLLLCVVFNIIMCGLHPASKNMHSARPINI